MKKGKVTRRSTGLPNDDLMKELEEFKKKALQELEEAKRKAKEEKEAKKHLRRKHNKGVNK